MKKSINAWTIPDAFSFEQSFECAARAGFDGIELNIDAPGPSAHSLSMDTTAADAAKIAELSRKYSVAVSGISTSLWGASPIGALEPEKRAQGLKLLRKQAELARALGADGILIVPGGIGENLSIRAAYESAQETFQSWRACIEDCGVMVGIENVWNNFFLSPMDMARFLDDLAIRNLGAYFDVGNVRIFSRPEHWIEVLGSRIQKIHVKDFLCGHANSGTFVNLLEGSVNWNKVVPALRKAGYDSYLTAELSAMPHANDYMMDITSKALSHIIALYERGIPMKKLAYIGCGGIAQYHLGNMLSYKDYLDQNDVRFAGFCDLIPERAEEFVRKTGSGKAYTDYKKMYDEVQPDLVFICIPPYCHGEIDLETFRRGIPAYVEKPVTLDLDLGEEILGVIRKNHVTTAVGFQCRYGNVADLTRQFCAEHEIVFCNMVRMGGVPDAFWWQKKELSGGQIVEQTIHNFDMTRFAMGDPIEVCTFGARGFVRGLADYDTDDVSTTIVRFASGALGTLSTGDYALGSGCYDSKITFSARDTRLDHYLLSKVVVYSNDKQQESASVVKGDGMLRGSGEGTVIKSDGRESGCLSERTFIDAVLSGDPSHIRSPYSDGIKSVAFTLACNESMAKGKVVRVRTF